MMKQPLDSWAHIRLNENEAKALGLLQERLRQKSRSVLLRKMIREAVGLGPDLFTDDLNAFREGVRQVAVLGRNVNQITRAIHSGHAAGLSLDSQLLQELALRIDKLKNELVEIVMRCRHRWVKYL